MFNRETTTYLNAWRESPYRRPLIIRGARQVGKTTMVNELGASYPTYLYLNLEEDARAREILEQDIDIETKVRMLHAIKGIVSTEQDTLIFIDEIQNSPKTITLLRYFYERMPHLHVIAAGSLLENLVDVKVSFPVGRVQYLAVRPCSFFEFVGAMGREAEYKVLVERPELSKPFHEAFMALFDQYTIVGGMPQAIARYCEQRDILAIEDVYSTLLTAYRDDVEKYVRHSKLREAVLHILQYGWGFAGETITMGNFAGSSYNSTIIKESFTLIEKAMLAELVYPTTATKITPIPQLRRKPKLIWLDTGLVNFAAGIRSEVIRARDITDVWRGRIAEHIVAQELLSMSRQVNATRMFWIKGSGGANSAEVDFLYQENNLLVPIEVKSGHNSHLRSLHSFIDASDGNIAVRVWAQPFSIDDVSTIIKHKPFRLINVPFYLIGQLPSLLKRYI